MRYKESIIKRAKATYNMCNEKCLFAGIKSQKELRQDKVRASSTVSLDRKFFNKRKDDDETVIIRTW